MKILDSRFMVLQYLLNASDKITIPLIGFDGHSFLPMSGTSESWTGCFDDIGIYILIPKLVTLLNVSLQQGIDIFFYSLQYIPFLISIIGFFLLYSSLLARCAAVGMITLLLCTVIRVPITDVYLAYCAAPLSVIPLFLYFLQNKLFGYLSCFLVFSGVVLGTLHYIRSYSGLCVIGFLLVMLICTSFFTVYRKIMLISCLFLGLCLPYGYFTYVINKYTAYSQEHFKEYDVTNCHPFWTTVYAGFGFLKYLNIDDISFEDSYVAQKVQQKRPGLSFLKMQEFENVVKKEVFDLIRNQCFFVIVTLFAKFGVLLFYVLKYVNLGLLAIFFVRKKWWEECAWLCCLGLSALFPLMTLPQGNYALSFIACCTLYGIRSLSILLESFSLTFIVRKILHKIVIPKNLFNSTTMPTDAA